MKKPPAATAKGRVSADLQADGPMVPVHDRTQGGA